ncbi:MAG: hypothetical protein D6736_11440 [Nitrospinota bacterium]|nr:MAG: hypothetical protein D6736_11440 [Nitrospinota bacterium]
MGTFLQDYGLWLLLAVFIGMHLFGLGCGGAHSHGHQRKREPQDHHPEEIPPVEPDGEKPPRETTHHH